MFTGNDMEILKKECQDLDKLLIPACKVDLMMVLGEGNYSSLLVIVCYESFETKMLHIIHVFVKKV